MRRRRNVTPRVHMRLSFLFNNEIKFFTVCGRGYLRDGVVTAPSTTEATQVTCGYCINKMRRRHCPDVGNHFPGFSNDFRTWANSRRA
jgi:hypothetical protein